MGKKKLSRKENAKSLIPSQVLVVEAGIDEPCAMQVPSLVSPFGNDNVTSWGYKLEPEPLACRGFPQNRCDWHRAKILGGCSAHHGLAYVRGIPRDYDDWEKAGNKGWGYKDVLPVFKRSEGNTNIGSLYSSQYHGSKGPLTTQKYSYTPAFVTDMLKAVTQVGLPITADLNGKDFVGFAKLQANIRYGVRVSSAKAFLRPQKSNPNLHVMLNSTVTKILINHDKEATGVELSYRSKSFLVKARKEVILAGGTVNTPQLLLLSGVGPKEVLDEVAIEQIHELPGVGRNATDHVSIKIPLVLTKVKDINEMNLKSLKEYLNSRGGPLAAPGLTQLLGRINSKYADPSGNNPDLLLMMYGFTTVCSDNGDDGPTNDNEIISISPTVLHPLSRGYISLKSKNPFDHPKIVANYLKAKEDQEVLLEGVRILLKLINSTLLQQKYGIEVNRTAFGDCSNRYKYNSDEFWICAMMYATAPGEHQTSSCRMGPSSDRFAVVDDRLRVHGIKNLRIADASIMPEIVTGNTLATVVMIGDQAARFITEAWSKKY
ncbi:hypothetical protein JTB14_021437 [Gonioctena quinquepunctata]|nr:hypothetical protein JTB14_021437 [Gonioctena quinquepunctata]